MLESLNEEMGNSFDLENAEVDRYLSSSYAVVYNTKIDPKYYPWQVMLWADYIIARRGSPYNYIAVDPYGFFCFGF
jgi:hypothetical protein